MYPIFDALYSLYTLIIPLIWQIDPKHIFPTLHKHPIKLYQRQPITQLSLSHYFPKPFNQHPRVVHPNILIHPSIITFILSHLPQLPHPTYIDYIFIQVLYPGIKPKQQVIEVLIYLGMIEIYVLFVLVAAGLGLIESCGVAREGGRVREGGRGRGVCEDRLFCCFVWVKIGAVLVRVTIILWGVSLGTVSVSC
jgi:hypothetical protein